MDLAGEVRKHGLPYRGRGPLVAAAQQLWWRLAIQPAATAVLLQWMIKKQWVVAQLRLIQDMNSTLVS